MEPSTPHDSYQLRQRSPHAISTVDASLPGHEPAADTSVTALENEDHLDDPQQWSSLKKLCHIIPVGSLVSAVTMGSSIISPAADQIAEEFGVSREAAILPFVSINLIVVSLT